MKSVATFLFVCVMLSLGGCATVMKGTTQDVAIDSNPQGATCDLTRKGVKLGVIDSTPGKFQVSRSQDALTVTCNKTGFATGTATGDTKFNGATFGNILAGGVIGVVVDASTGANYSYPDQITVTLAGEGDASATPMAATPATTETAAADAPAAATAAAAPAAAKAPAAATPAAATPAAAPTPAVAATPAAASTPAAAPKAN